MTVWFGSGDCREAVVRLYHYLDGELDDARRALIRRHLDECPPCLEAFDFEAELRALIARKCREPAPEALRIRIAQAIQLDTGPVEAGGWESPGPGDGWWRT